jgi:hypothetical protein
VLATIVIGLRVPAVRVAYGVVVGVPGVLFLVAGGPVAFWQSKRSVEDRYWRLFGVMLLGSVLALTSVLAHPQSWPWLGVGAVGAAAMALSASVLVRRYGSLAVFFGSPDSSNESAE